MAENGENRRRSYNFIVYLEGKRIGFERLSGLSEEENFEVLREGGWNRAVYALVSGGGRQERSLTLERGVLEREMEFRLYQPGYRFREEVAIYVADQKGEIKKEYYLAGAYIRRISLNELSARDSGLQVASIELGYETLEEEGSRDSGAWRKL